jgi:glutamate synthase domain-containing protein 2
VKAIGKGLSKIMSKMGVSTYMSYCGAQLFEAIGLEKSLVEKYFRGTASQVGGIGVFQVAEEAIRMHRAAFGEDPVLAGMLDGGRRIRMAGARRGAHVDAGRDCQAAAQRARQQVRHVQGIRANHQRPVASSHDPARPVRVQVRSEQGDSRRRGRAGSEIVKRFATGAMSLGSISTEAHSTLAIAMNRIGGKSNTGEGGEDPARYRNELKGIPIKDGTKVSEVVGEKVIEADYALKDGDSLRSKIKQVASGRFGVTTEYLVSADQIQIKMAQGAKPGEGGQLPGGKVSDYIGFLRYSVPGVGLISPPPHHDIYSIEDLAQLIHDLKNANQRASVSVKLVSEVGVGTIAAGVAKAKADHVVIAGHDGGTGASPWSSIKHAGTPWELGLAETQQTLVLNRLRSRIRVQADGQMKTGRDVVIGALLGADEFGFATAPLVVEGCIMMRKCHLNTCPVGVATQDPVLRKKFRGPPRARGELLLLRGRGGAPDHGAAGHPQVRRSHRPRRPARHEEGHRALEGRRASTSAASSTCRPPRRVPRVQSRAGPRPRRALDQRLIEKCSRPSSAARRCSSWRRRATSTARSARCCRRADRRHPGRPARPDDLHPVRGHRAARASAPSSPRASPST